jgi:hypothetical protein
MNGFINVIADTLIRFDLLKEDLDYHLIRASMVIIFLFFGYQTWFEYEAQMLIPYINNGPSFSGRIPYSVPRRQLVSGRVGMSVRPAAFWAFGTRGRASGVPAARLFVRHDSDDHSFHAERPGPGGRLSSNGR